MESLMHICAIQIRNAKIFCNKNFSR